MLQWVERWRSAGQRQVRRVVGWRSRGGRGDVSHEERRRRRGGEIQEIDRRKCFLYFSSVWSSSRSKVNSPEVFSVCDVVTGKLNVKWQTSAVKPSSSPFSSVVSVTHSLMFRWFSNQRSNRELTYSLNMSGLTLLQPSCRGVGCILYEMATGRPMFPGATVKEELHLIFRLIGRRTAAKSNDNISEVHLGWICDDCAYCPRPQARPQRTAGLGSALMRSLGRTSFLSTDLRLWSTTCPGTN